jgi:hypothetical protein
MPVLLLRPQEPAPDLAREPTIKKILLPWMVQQPPNRSLGPPQPWAR